MRMFKEVCQPYFQSKIFHLDYSRQTGIYRMLENFVPKAPLMRNNLRPTTAEDEDADVPAPKKKGAQDAEQGEGTRFSGSWPKGVCVTSVAWDNGGGMAHAPFLASATASGLCRIDWLLGQFYSPRYNAETIAVVRAGEKDFDGEEDEDELDD